MVHVTTRMIPFEALFGRPTSTVLSYEKGSGLVNEIDRLLINRDEILDVLKVNLLTAQQRMVKYANMKRREVQFEVHDWVYVKLRPRRQFSLVGISTKSWLLGLSVHLWWWLGSVL